MKKLVEKAQNDSTVMWLVVVASFLLGIVVGMFCAPAKNGLSIGCNNSVYGGDDDDEKDFDWNDGYDEDEVVEF